MFNNMKKEKKVISGVIYDNVSSNLTDLDGVSGVVTPFSIIYKEMIDRGPDFYTTEGEVEATSHTLKVLMDSRIITLIKPTLALYADHISKELNAILNVDGIMAKFGKDLFLECESIFMYRYFNPLSNVGTMVQQIKPNPLDFIHSISIDIYERTISKCIDTGIMVNDGLIEILTKAIGILELHLLNNISAYIRDFEQFYSVMGKRMDSVLIGLGLESPCINCEYINTCSDNDTCNK